MTVRNQKIAVFSGLGIIILGLILLAVFYREPVTLPSGFLDAYKNAAEVSEEIRLLTNATTENIKGIEISDGNGELEKAKQFIESARKENAGAYSKAFELSSHLRKMAESLGGISSRKAQQSAYEAVATELALVSEFINYTQYMASFLDGLDQAVKSNNFGDRKAVEQLEREINKKVAVINKLNSDFKNKMQAIIPKSR